MGTLLLLVLGVAVAGGIAYFSYVQNEKRRALLLSFCRSNGWAFAARDDSWTQAWTGDPFGQGERRQARNVLSGSSGGRPMVAFDYSYVTRSSDGQGRSTTTTHRYAVCALQLPAWLPRLQVVPENVLTRIGNAVGLADIELESEDFNRRFRVSGADPKFASDVLSPRTMELLLGRPALHWRVEGQHLLCWESGRTTPAGLIARLSTLAAVAEGIPSFVWRDHGADPVSPPSPGSAPA